jgi:3-methyl-2-oxobutanoate hydroxymethyltransferase
MTIPDLHNKKRQGKKITLLTAYDYPSASFIDKAGIDIILVGDSLAMSVLGYESTLPVTMEEMVHHARAVRRAVKNAVLVGDIPLEGCNKGVSETVKNATRYKKEAGCDGVKLEGAGAMLETIKAVIAADIAVMGHVGLTPQTASDFKVQGKDAEGAQRIIDDALSLEKAGVFSVILECIPDELAKVITNRLGIPTIGIGAGVWCDGQALVTNDMLGLFERFTPKFVKKYANLSEQLTRAFKSYKEEVEDLKFPTTEHSFHMKKDQIERLK